MYQDKKTDYTREGIKIPVDFHVYKGVTLRAKQVREKQSRLESSIEVGANISSGFIISYLVWVFVVPVLWPEHASSHGVAFGITALFTVSSIIRSYLWRRFFENELHKLVHRFIKGLK